MVLGNSSPVQALELQEIPAFREISLDQLSRLAGLMVRQTYEPDQIIFLEGDQAGALWFVSEGRVKIIKQSLNGRIQGLCLMNRGKCFGGCPLFDMETNPATAQAIDQVTLFVLPASAIQLVRQREPQLISVLTRVYSQRLQHLARISEVLGSWSVADRINDCLVTYSSQDDDPPVVRLTHDRLAALSGTVREVVSRHLALLEKSGIVHSAPGRIILLNPGALVPPCACEDHPGVT